MLEPVAVGYLRQPLLDPAAVEALGVAMRRRAEALGYRWGGLYLDHTQPSDQPSQTQAALARRVRRQPEIWTVLVPDHTHHPGLPAAGGPRNVRIATANTPPPTARDPEKEGIVR
ncbi:hypothetical protein [Nocardia puris]|nr:hypothetical protein [Nocardia puris]